MASPHLIERRENPQDQAVVALINTLMDQVKELRSEVHDLKRSNSYTHAVSTEAIERAVTKAMNAGFPDGDPEGHRRDHELRIQAAEDRAKFWATLRSDAAKWGMLGLAGWLVVTLWNAFLQGPKS